MNQAAMCVFVRNAQYISDRSERSGGNVRFYLF